MAETLVVVCEARADFQTSTRLADRVFCECIDWMEHELLGHCRRYVGLADDQPFLTWFDVKRLSRDSGIRPRGFIEFDDQQPEQPDLDARQTQRAIRLIESRWPDIRGILLIRDDDRQRNRRAGMEQARRESAISERIVIGLAHTKRECWILAGFEPRDEREQELLATVRQGLGFDPRLHADLLTAKHDHDKKSAKGILQDLVQGRHDREVECCEVTPIPLLKQRGMDTGLSQYLDEIEKLGKLLFVVG